MIAFAAAADRIAATPARLEKIALVAAYLATLDDADLAAATRFFTGNPFAQRDDRRLAVGGRTIVAAAKAVWGIDDAALSDGYRATGDLGAALGPLVRPALDLGLFAQPLHPAGFKLLLDEIADAAGKSAGRKRQLICERILAACTAVLETTYVVKIMTGDLRIGLRAGLIVDAVASAFGRDAVGVRRAAAAAGDLGAVAVAARHDTLDDVALHYHAPLAFMLAAPIAYESEYTELASASWLVEDKFDGVRISAHVTPERISLFSRTLNDVAPAFPEIVAALRGIAEPCILDGEVVAQRDGRILPFRYLQPRLQRKVVAAELLESVPVRYVIFDVLARGADVLLDLPLVERRGALAEVCAGLSDVATAAAWTALPADATRETVLARFAQARGAGNEGLIFKRTDSPYLPGRRGRWWLKLKRELSTLDVVVVAVERGHGKRVNMLSDYTFAVRGPDGALQPIGKAYSGLTDAEITELTGWFETHRLPRAEARTAYARLDLKRSEIVVEPAIVLEIAFDIIQKSTLHASGYALRFPRIVRLRPDKRVEDIDTVDRVDEIYIEMLAREGVDASSVPADDPPA